MWSQRFLQYVSVRRFDPFVVVLLRFHDLKAKLLIEVDSTLVVYLNVPIDKIRISYKCFSKKTEKKNPEKYIKDHFFKLK